MPADWERRFWSKVNKTSTCWLWTARIDAEGYGRLFVDGRCRLAHALIWERKHGPIPKGMKVCHSCDQPACVRDEHLFLGSQLENMRDAARKLRLRHKLNHEEVLEIRALAQAGTPRKLIQQRFSKVSYWTICDIVNGRSRQCVPVGIVTS